MEASVIELTKRVSNTADGRHRLQVWVSRTTNNIPSEIFVYQRFPSVPLYPDLQDIFVHVASYADLEDFPVGDPEDLVPFYRKYAIDIVFESLAVLLEKWDMLRKQVTHTVEDLVRLYNLAPAEVLTVEIREQYVTIPGLPQTGD